MNYTDFTSEQFLNRIEELEVLNRELMAEKERETKLEYAWTGNLGHWYWNIKTNAASFNTLKVIALGYDESEIPEQVTYQFFTDKLHPDDHEKTMNVMRNHLNGKANVYEAEYRIQTKNGKYKWYYDRGRITQYDDKGKPLLLAGIVFDITEKKEMELDLKEKNELLAEQATTDGLTGLSNHRKIIEQLKSEMADASRRNTPLSVAIFDIDNFKRVNDTKGHIFGDKVLVDVASLINKSIRKVDFAGRYGGEEFMVIFTNTDYDMAAKISERVRIAVEEYTFVDGLKITISGGVKQYNGEILVDFVHSTDINLYEAKRKGKNQIV